MADPREEISVRMYRWLLGDCFLLTHTARRADGNWQTFRALIDCGVLHLFGSEENKPSTALGRGQIRKVVADIAKGGPLDLVIATHEHYDHLSGFIRENEAFQKIGIGEVWLAWTENPNDKLASDIRDNGRRALAALKAIADAQHLKLNGEDDDRVVPIRDLMQFYGEDDFATESERLAMAGGAVRPPYKPGDPPRRCAHVLEWLRHRVGEAKVKYLEPGQIVQFGVNLALKAYVLGPPRRADRLLQMNPTEGATKEVYLVRRDHVRSLETMMRFHGLVPAKASPDDPDPPPLGPTDHPFSERFHRTPEEQAEGPVAQLYHYSPFEERRIDGEWLGTAEALALKIDHDVNNTSLVLAIEVPGRHVLLFPADAQVGSWLSWKDQRYPAKPEEANAPTETIDEILSRVVLYKVGHHCSHNATARAEGLELMTSPHLVAMIPVVEETAREQKTRTNPNGWAMPYADLNKRLKEKTRERIVQGDGDPVLERQRFERSIFSLAHELEDDPNSLWVELTLPLAEPGSANPQTPTANTPIGG